MELRFTAARFNSAALVNVTTGTWEVLGVGRLLAGAPRFPGFPVRDLTRASELDGGEVKLAPPGS
ncbi:MAG TPA: hypothetical protein DCE44_13160 [Verrucomicrobiales bacterium]|nr:hypothetical protein [Verrucomicrobiales bacterium]